MIDKDGTVLQRKVYPLTQASAAGDFLIPDNFKPSRLTVRCYTTWMLNFDTTFLFKKSIEIVSKDGKAAPELLLTVARQITLGFFAEGGDLVNGIESTVAFKATDNNGKPVFVEGNIRNDKGANVVKFTTQHDGMGKFNLTPQAGEIYSAIWKDDRGVQQTTTLPAAKNEGVVIGVSGAGDKKIFILKRSADVPPTLKNLYVEAHLAQELVYKAKVPLVNSFMNSGSIKVADLPAGILQITVFSEDWKPVAERIVIVNNDNYEFDVAVKPLEANLNIRAKNIIKIEAGDTTLSNMSISVTDADVVSKTEDDNIISRMLLTGDLRGYVHNPAYYFSNTSDSVASHLDLVMLTHGWRRFNWNDLANARRPQLKFPTDSYLAINAKVFGITPSNPLRSDEQITAIITAKDSSNQIVLIPKAGLDFFSLPEVVFFDTVKIHWQYNKDRRLESKTSIKFNNGLYEGANKIDASILPVDINVKRDTAALNRTRFLAEQVIKFGSSWAQQGNVLQSVTVKTRVKSRAEQLDEKYANGLFAGGDALSFDMTDQTGFMDVFSFLQGRVAGLRITTFPTPSVSWRNGTTALFLDEMRVEADQLQGLSPADIAYIKVFRPPFIGAFGGGDGGAIAIYTRRGSDVASQPGKGLSSSKLVGYSYSKEFYSPNYSTRSASSDVVADYRSTLYWKPFVFLDGSQRATTIQFYNNDITKKFRVILEGVNEAGKLVRVEKIIQ